FSNREPAVAQHLRISSEQLGRGGEMPAESLLEMRDDRSGRPDRQLLARDLEDERPERIERRKLVHPGAWTEVWMRVDHACEHGIGLAEELSRLGVGERGTTSSSRVHAHSCSSRASPASFQLTALRPDARGRKRTLKGASARKVFLEFSQLVVSSST